MNIRQIQYDGMGKVWCLSASPKWLIFKGRDTLTLVTEAFSDMEQWCDHNCNGEWQMAMDQTSYLFSERDDAIRFRLTFV